MARPIKTIFLTVLQLLILVGCDDASEPGPLSAAQANPSSMGDPSTTGPSDAGQQPDDDGQDDPSATTTDAEPEATATTDTMDGATPGSAQATVSAGADAGQAEAGAADQLPDAAGIGTASNDPPADGQPERDTTEVDAATDGEEPVDPGLEADATTDQSGKTSRPGAYGGYSEPLYAEYKITSQYVTVRDGTKLAIDIYRPLEADGSLVETPLPVVWMHTPYCRRVPLPGNELSMAEIYPGQAGKLVRYGYVVAIADFRGLYASYGKNIGYNRGEWVYSARMDAYDVTEWLADQPWSTGNIGMWGCSATGGSQMQAATTAPPSLKAVFPMSCEFDAYPFGVPGGMAPQTGPTRAPPTTVDQFLRNVLAAPVDDDLDRSQLNDAVTSHGDPLDNLGYMPFRDSIAESVPLQWWTESSPHTYLDKLNGGGTAFYVAANWDEAATKYGAFFTYNNLSRPAKLIIGPAPHCAWSSIPGSEGEDAMSVQGETGFDITVEEHRFFDYWLKDIDNGIMDEPGVYYYTYGAPQGQEWRAAETWPLPNEQRVSYYLHEGKLDTAAPTGSADKDSFVVSYEATAENAAEHGLVYETAPLTEPVEITGHAVVDLWLASTANDSDVVAYVQNVAPDGTTTSYSMHGRLRASLRKEAPAPYDNLGLPWHPFGKDDVQPLVPGEPVQLRFDVLPFSMVFNKGHRIRLVLAFADTATPQLSPAPTVSILRDAEHPSSITFPVIPHTL